MNIRKTSLNVVTFGAFLGLFGLILVPSLLPTQVSADDYLPVSVSINISPNTICSGQSAHLTWSSADATSVSINQGIGSVLPYGERYVFPNQTTTYTITGSNSSGGYGTATVTVYVSGCSTPTPVPTPTPTPAPVLISAGISVFPNTICSGQVTDLTWTTNNASSAFIDNGIGLVGLRDKRYISPSSTTTYTITATNVMGAMTTASTTVFVSGVCATPTPTPTLTPTPTPTPTPTASLIISKLVRDITTGSGESDSVNANQGDTVKMTIVNEDEYDHGIAIDAFGISQRVPAKGTINLQFVATQPGEFPYYCSVPCGEGEVDGVKRGHFDQVGRMKVKAAEKGNQ